MKYRLFSNCIPVKGFGRSIICDLQRHNFHFIPNSLHDLFDNEIIDINLKTLQLDSDEINILNEYIVYLIKHELIFELDSELVECFVPLSLNWDFPAKITNAILDGSAELYYLSNSFLNEILELGCYYFELRYYDSPTINELKRVLKLINNSKVKSIDIILKHSEDPSFYELLHDMVNKNEKIRCITIHTAPNDMIIHNKGNGHGIILSLVQEITSSNHCGNIHVDMFCISIKLFTESQQHNTCLNRKIAIDAEGNIKNCPSMTKSYGNIKDTKLIDVVNNPEFQKLWYIHKDQISVCRDCEFRHICTDCRAYLENPEDIYSKPLKCGYNPYTGEWEEWSSNPLKQQTMDYYKTK